MNINRKIIGLTRHTGTEPEGSSTRVVFQEIEAALSKNFIIERLPFYWQALTGSKKEELFFNFINKCDTILDAPGYSDARLLYLRNKFSLKTPIAWLDLGNVVRGAVSLRDHFKYFQYQDIIFFTSSADQKIFLKLTKQCRASSAILPLSIDEGFRIFEKPEEKNRITDLRYYLGIPSEATIFLYAGRMMVEKNVHSILLMFSELITTHPDCVLLLVGDMLDVTRYSFGNAPQDISNIFKSILNEFPQLSERCKIYPLINREELPLIYNLADVFINLTLHGDENFGFSQIEAMACACPMITTHWGGLKDSLRHGVNGFAVDTKINLWGIRADLNQALNYSRMLVESPDLRLSLGSAGAEIARVEYSRECLSRQLCQQLDNFTPYKGQLKLDENELSKFGNSYHHYFSDNKNKAKAPRYTIDNYLFYRTLIEPYSTGFAGPIGNEIAVAPLSFNLRGDTIEVVDPIWQTVFNIDQSEKKMLAILYKSLIKGRRFFDVEYLVANSGLTILDAKDALFNLAKKGIIIGENIRP